MKTCTGKNGCGKLLLETAFSKDLKNKDRLNKVCKSCKSIKDKEYRQLNLIKIATRSKEWRETNSVKNKKKKQLDYLINKDAYKARAKKSANNNIQHRKDYMKDYYINNKEAMDANFLKSIRKRRAKKLELNESFSKNDVRFTKAVFNNKCFNCGSVTNLCIDHHLPLSKGNILTKWNAVILCNCCNVKKHNHDPINFYTFSKYIEISNILLRIKHEFKSIKYIWTTHK